MTTDSSQPKNTFHPSVWHMGLGIALLLICLGFASGLVWLFASQPLSQWTGKMWVLIFLSPIALVMLLGGIIAAAKMVLVGFVRYDLDPTGLTVHGLFRSTSIAWSDVRDFALEPATFPDPPATLALIASDGKRLDVPLDVRPKDIIKGLILSLLPTVAAHGIERVKRFGVTPASHSLRRWDRPMGSLIVTLCRLVLFIFCAAGSYIAADKYIDYRRIIANPVAAQAEITEIKHDGDKTYVRVTYSASDDTTHKLRRRVPRRFDDQFDVGDTITVDYLAGDPTTARIRDWDLDSRRWLILAMTIPFGWVCFLITASSIKSLFSPQREIETWAAAKVDQGWAVMTSTPDLEANVAVWPDRHDNTTGVFIYLKRKETQDSYDNISPYHKILEESEIMCRLVADTFIIVGQESMDRLLSRLGQKATVDAQYYLLRNTDVDKAEAWALKNLAGNDDQEPPADWFDDVALLSRDKMVGPVEQNELTPAFDRWVKLQLHRIYDGYPPEGVLQADFAKLLKIPDGESVCRLMFERRSSTVRVYCERPDSDGVMLAEYGRDMWTVWPWMPTPKAMRSRHLLAWITIILLGPLGLIVLFVQLLIWPINYLLNRGRLKKLDAAREAVIGNEK